MAETTVDYQDAERFLKLLDPDAEAFDFRCIHPKSGDVWNGSGTQADLHDELLGYNSNGFGVFLTINETDGKGRRTENIKRVRAVWQDDDAGWKGEYPLEPSIVVQTSAGKHQRYWLVDGPMELMSFGGIMARIVQDHGGDAGARDLARVLRLPGYYHTKGERQLVEIIGGSGKRYTEAELVKHFPPIARKVTEPREAGEASPGWQKDKSRAADALRFLAGKGYAEDRENWFKYGAAIFDASGGSDQAVWDAWAKSCPEKYNQDIQDYYWTYEFDSDRGNRTTIATIFQDAYKVGWKEAIEIKIRPELIQDSLSYIPLGPIATKAVDNLRKKFSSKEYSHFPSDNHWVGLEAIAKIIEEQANGSLPRLFHLSSLPAGMGKTSTLIETVRCLLDDETKKDVGVIIFVFRLAEIAKIAEDMKLNKNDYSVYTRDDQLNKLGNQEPTKARVMFTTQNMLENRSKSGRPFAKMSEFYYNGKPRKVRVWDEAILPSKIFTLQRKKIFGLIETFTDECKALAEDLELFTQKIKDSEDRTTVDVPDFNRHGVSMEDARTMFENQEQQDTVEVLFWFANRPVVIRRDQSGNAFLDYEDILPNDLSPMLILDASGSQRETYRFWYQDRGNLHPLKSPPKYYDGFTIHHWNRGSGKDTYKKDWMILTEGVAKAINEDISQNEDVLVVYKKPKKKEKDVSQLIKYGLRGNIERVKFCTWGQHTATNDFKDIKHVILASIHQLPVPTNEGYGRAAKGMKTEDKFSDEDYENTRLGEIAHNILQAANRGMVRKAIGESCPPDCSLYVIFPSQNVPQALLGRIFPRAKILDWLPVVPKLKGNNEKLAGYIEQSATMNVKTIIKQELMTKLSIKQQSYLNTLLKDEHLTAYLKTKGIEYNVTTKTIEIK